MDQTAALRLAIDLVQVPSRVRGVRTEPLPEGMLLLLRVAADDHDAARSAAEPMGRTPELLREAATFFIEQILLAPGSDSYRVLGAVPDASTSELRRHMALLVRWLHPDVALDQERTVFAGRVTAAWDDVKTPDRRALYDRGMGRSEERGARAKRSRQGRPSGQRLARKMMLAEGHQRPVSSFRRVLFRLLGR